MMPKRKTKKKSKNPDVLKPAMPAPAPVKPSDGPIFTARFDDGVTTRMSIYSPADELDLKRAIAVSRAAHSSRTKTPMAAATATIITARFETTTGVVLATYSTEDLAEAVTP